MPPTQVPELNLLRREVVARAARLEVRFRTRLAELSRQSRVRGPQLARLRVVRRDREVRGLPGLQRLGAAGAHY